MRIISGELGGRRFNPPANMPYTRPTTDIAKYIEEWVGINRSF